jgi:hypothetical protein
MSDLDARIPAGIRRWIKTECGRAKYLALAAPTGPLARLRLAVVVLLAAIHDLPLPRPEEAVVGLRDDRDPAGHP